VRGPAQALKPQPRSAITREKLILAAESLYSERGPEGVAFREISKLAGQRNSNVIQYHFGDRQGLLDAIFTYRAGQAEPIRRRMMEEAAEQGLLDDIKTLLRLILAPEFEVCRQEGHFHYARLTIYYMLYMRPRGVPHPYDRRDPTTTSLREVVACLLERLSFLPSERLGFRVDLVNTLLLGALTMISHREAQGGESLEILMDDALNMMAAGIAVPAADMPG